MALLVPDELEKYVKKLYNENGAFWAQGTNGKMWSTTTSSTSSASTGTWGGNGLYYYQTVGYSTNKSKEKEPNYIPSDELSEKRKFDKDFKFDPSFLEMEGGE